MKPVALQCNNILLYVPVQMTSVDVHVLLLFFFLNTVEQSNAFNKFTSVKSCSSLNTENSVFMCAHIRVCS